MWQILRNMHNIPNKVEPITFSKVNSDMPSLLLQPKEKVHIPFSYCTVSVQPSHLELFKVFEHQFLKENLLFLINIINNYLV